MKVFLISKVPAFDGTASASRFKCFARAINQSNCSAEIIMYRHYTMGENKKTGYINDVPYRYIGIKSNLEYNTLFRGVLSVLNEFILNFFLLLKLKKGDVVFFFDEEPIWGNLLIYSTHLRKAKFVEEICEFPYGRGEETAQTKRNRKIIENRQFPKYDGVITISESLRDYMSQHVNNHCKLLKVPIMVDIQEYLLNNTCLDSEKKYIFHSGTLFEQKDGILGMLEAFGNACQIMNYSIFFISTGSIEKSPHSKEISEIIKKYSIEKNVMFTGYVSNDALKEYLRNATAVIINKNDNQQNNYCFSTKLGEYAAAGKIIMISRVGEACNWLKDSSDALFYNAGDIDKLKDLIISVFSDIPAYLKVGDKAKESAKKYFDYRVYSTTLENYFKDL